MILNLKGKKFEILSDIFNFHSIGTRNNHTWIMLFYLYRLSRNKDIVLTNELLSKELFYGKKQIVNVTNKLEKNGLINKTKINRIGNSVIYTTKYELTPFGIEIASNIYNIVKLVYKNENQIHELKEDEKINNKIIGEVVGFVKENERT